MMFFKRFLIVAAVLGNAIATTPSDELEQLFRRAEGYVRTLPADESDQLSRAEKLEMYANYKQATMGPLSENEVQQPGFFSFEARAKYDAWSALGDKSSEQAMEDYVAKLDELSPSWRED